METEYFEKKSLRDTILFNNPQRRWGNISAFCECCVLILGDSEPFGKTPTL